MERKNKEFGKIRSKYFLNNQKLASEIKKASEERKKYVSLKDKLENLKKIMISDGYSFCGEPGHEYLLAQDRCTNWSCYKRICKECSFTCDNCKAECKCPIDRETGEIIHNDDGHAFCNGCFSKKSNQCYYCKWNL